MGGGAPVSVLRKSNKGIISLTGADSVLCWLFVPGRAKGYRGQGSDDRYQGSHQPSGISFQRLAKGRESVLRMRRILGKMTSFDDGFDEF